MRKDAILKSALHEKLNMRTNSHQKPISFLEHIRYGAPLIALLDLSMIYSQFPKIDMILPEKPSVSQHRSIMLSISIVGLMNVWLINHTTRLNKIRYPVWNLAKSNPWLVAVIWEFRMTL